MRILYLQSLEPSALDLLRGALAPGLTVDAAAGEMLPTILPQAAGYEALVAGIPPAELLAAATRLRALVIPYAGVPARTRDLLGGYPDLVVLNSHFNARYAAEHAWALLLAAAKRIVPADRALRGGDWTIRYDGPLSQSLAGKTLCLVGYGAIGRALAAMARPFGMRVTAIRRRQQPARELDAVGGPADLNRYLGEADAVIASLPHSPETEALLGVGAFAAMKPGAIFVNVGRGGSVDEDAFAAALASGRLGAAAIDTWWHYPASGDAVAGTAPSTADLSGFDNLVFSPHRASHCEGREDERLREVARILNAFAAGEPINVVDRETWY